jgi:hypothetical protein
MIENHREADRTFRDRNNSEGARRMKKLVMGESEYPIIDFTFSTSYGDVDTNDGGERFVRNISGSIKIFDEDVQGVGMTIGHIALKWLQIGNMMNARVDAFAATDSDSHEAHEAYMSIYKVDGEIHPEIEERYSMPTNHDVLLLQKLEIDKAYRGRGIGLWANRVAINTFGGNCAFAVLRPFPLQYEGWEGYANSHDPKERAIAAEPDFEKKRVLAFSKLAKYYEQGGFRQLPKVEDYLCHEMWAYCPELSRQPPLAEARKWRNKKKSNGSPMPPGFELG